MNRSVLKARVAAGAALLDERLPDWPGHIDLEKLQVSNTRTCVLGQIHGDYQKGAQELNLSGVDAVELGFFTSEADHSGEAACREYAELTELWKTEATQRLAA